MAAPAREFAVMDWTSKDDDIYLKAQRTNSECIEFDVEITDSEGKGIAWETLVPSNSGAGLKNLSDQISKHYYALNEKDTTTPEQLLDLYS